MNIKDLVSDGKIVRFKFYRANELWYETENRELIFPVPISDIGAATFNAEDKAMLFMRYIRKYLEVLNND